MSKYVALQLVGLIRGFRFEKTRLLFYERIIKQLVNQGFKVHIFWHTYDILGHVEAGDPFFDDQPVEMMGRPIGNKEEVINLINSIDKNKFDIKLYQIDSDKKQHDFLQKDYKLEEKYKFHKHWTKNHRYGWFKFTYSIREVNKLRINYENKNDIKYDWVIVTSPQMEPQTNIDNFNLLNNNFMYSPRICIFWWIL